MNENTEKIRSQVISLIESEYDSDASFEREMDLAPKTVNNWRRGRSSSFMRMLPNIADCFGINISKLILFITNKLMAGEKLTPRGNRHIFGSRTAA